MALKKKPARAGAPRADGHGGYGPGAMIDLPDHAVIVGGLEGWRGHEAAPVHEPRLAAKLRRAQAADP